MTHHRRKRAQGQGNRKASQGQKLGRSARARAVHDSPSARTPRCGCREQGAGTGKFANSKQNKVRFEPPGLTSFTKIVNRVSPEAPNPGGCYPRNTQRVYLPHLSESPPLAGEHARAAAAGS